MKKKGISPSCLCTVAQCHVWCDALKALETLAQCTVASAACLVCVSEELCARCVWDLILLSWSQCREMELSITMLLLLWKCSAYF